VISFAFSEAFQSGEAGLGLQMHAHISSLIFFILHGCVPVCACLWVRVRARVCMPPCVRARVCVCVPVCACPRVCVPVCACPRVCVPVPVCACGSNLGLIELDEHRAGCLATVIQKQVCQDGQPAIICAVVGLWLCLGGLLRDNITQVTRLFSCHGLTPEQLSVLNGSQNKHLTQPRLYGQSAERISSSFVD